MSYIIEQWKQDKLRCALIVCWLMTVATSFFNAYLLPIELPGVGTWYAFRSMIPITSALYVICAIRDRSFFWKDSCKIEKWCYIFIACMFLYGAASLPRALDAAWTFRRFFNLCFDLCFFFLMLRLCRKEDVRRLTLAVCFALWSLMMLLGLYEIFSNKVVGSTSGYETVNFFNSLYRAPVVFYGNPNDYAMMLVFIYALFALHQMKNKSLPRWSVIVISAVICFLLLACDARLCIAGFSVLIAAQLLLWLVREKRVAVRPAIALCLCLACVWLVNQWSFKVQPIITYCEEYWAYQMGVEEKPTLNWGESQNESLKDQFFVIDEETGKQVIRGDSSAGTRTKLLLSAWDCFKESYGLGVGLGNAETLAPLRGVIPGWADNSQNSIHCFLARIIADCGIFALIPLCAIAALLLKKILVSLIWEIKKRDWKSAVCTLLVFAALSIYPVVSTASSDAQDAIPMWIYLAGIALTCKDLQRDHQGEIGQTSAEKKIRKSKT